jgi:parallel beta-helix repeat protein
MASCAIKSAIAPLYLNIIQQSGRDGVIFYHSHGRVISDNISSNAQAGVDVLNGSTVDTISNTVTGNGYVGIAVVNGSSVSTLSNTVSGNDDSGMVVASGSSLFALQDTIQNNARFGIWVLKGAALVTTDLTITGNNSDGVNLSQASSAAFEQSITGNLITGNGGHGVSIGGWGGREGPDDGDWSALR